MKRICNIFILGLFNIFHIVSQNNLYVLSGTVLDEKNQPLSFAAISIVNTNKGTTANEKGEFEFKLNKGNYQIVVQFLGYKKHYQNIVLNENKHIKIILYPEEIQLNEVNINAAEDPAYRVIRAAIKSRKRHNKELNKYSYQCNVYIKGVQKLLDIPDKIMGIKVEVNENEGKGIFYLSETRSTFYFSPPSKKKEIIHASRVSGQSKGFSFNRYIPMQKNMYENNLDFYFISNRPFISPISENALLFYKYKMQGTFFEDGKMINKIEVIPKSATEPCFRGYIYIEENTWRIHSYDFYITKAAKLNFIDTLWLKQVNAKMNDSVYYPVSVQYLFNFSFLGIKGNGYFIASVSDYIFNKDTLPKKFFKNEMVRFEKDAVKNDSAYWNNVRPIPLSDEEKKDYIKKDSIEQVHTSPKYLDSLDKKNNKFRFSNILYGYRYQKTRHHFNINIDGLLTAGIQYNTVEGWNVSLNSTIQKEYNDEMKKLIWKNAWRYGTGNQLFGFKSNISYADNPFNFRNYGMNIQYYVEPFNHEYSIPEIINTSYTLLDYRNYLKLYLKKSIDIFYHQEIINGVYFDGKINTEERLSLSNTYSLAIYKHKNHFTSNNPLYPYTDSTSFPTHQAFILDVKLKYRFKQKYTTYPDKKVVWNNKYPVITLQYIKAVPFNTLMVNYDLIKLKINSNIELNYFGDLKADIEAGKFLNTQKMYFMDYQHFAGNQTIILNEWNSFRLLNYYNFSTNDYFIQTHLQYNLRGLLIGKLPLIKKYKIEEIITAHYLYNPLVNNYYEVSFGLDKLFYIFRIEYAMAYYPSIAKPISQFLIGVNFLNNRR